MDLGMGRGGWLVRRIRRSVGAEDTLHSVEQGNRSVPARWMRTLIYSTCIRIYIYINFILKFHQHQLGKSGKYTAKNLADNCIVRWFIRLHIAVGLIFARARGDVDERIPEFATSPSAHNRTIFRAYCVNIAAHVNWPPACSIRIRNNSRATHTEHERVRTKQVTLYGMLLYDGCCNDVLTHTHTCSRKIAHNNVQQIILFANAMRCGITGARGLFSRTHSNARVVTSSCWCCWVPSPIRDAQSRFCSCVCVCLCKSQGWTRGRRSRRRRRECTFGCTRTRMRYKSTRNRRAGQ